MSGGAAADGDDDDDDDDDEDKTEPLKALTGFPPEKNVWGGDN